MTADLLPSRFIRCFVLVLGVVVAGMTAGCAGSSTPPGSGSTPTGNTSVTVLASSTANARLTSLRLTLTGLTLTNAVGATVTVVNTSQPEEYIHLNGSMEPMLTVQVPQGTYTSATATVTTPQLVCIDINADGGVQTNEAGNGTPKVTVSLPQPLVVSGSAMGVALNLQVSSTVSFNTCDTITATFVPSSVAPMFTLSAVNFSSTPVNLTQMRGLVTAASSNGLTVTNATGQTWSVTTGSNTSFEGVANASAVTVGMPVDMDTTIQTDGSMLATRVEVVDTNVSNLTMMSGPGASLASSVPVMSMGAVTQQGTITPGFGPVPVPYSLTGTTFQTTQQVRNLSSLPFTPVFNAATLFAGQSFVFTDHATSYPSGGSYIALSTVTLVPQTLNGTVAAVSTAGGFTTYTITLAPYDLVPNLSVQMGQTTAIKSANTVVVYADSNTQNLTSAAVGVGSVVRVNGLLFNDGGVARMDSLWIRDGVAF